MYGAIPITQLNDFVFCPSSIYFHMLYGDTDNILYQSRDQINGTAAHSAIDEQRYSDRKGYYRSFMKGKPVSSYRDFKLI